MSANATTWAICQPIKPTPKAVLFAIADCANAEGEGWPGIEYITMATGLERRAVIRATKYLQELGLIEVKARSTASGARTSNLYLLDLDDTKIELRRELWGDFIQRFDEKLRTTKNSIWIRTLQYFKAHSDFKTPPPSDFKAGLSDFKARGGDFKAGLSDFKTPKPTNEPKIEPTTNPVVCDDDLKLKKYDALKKQLLDLGFDPANVDYPKAISLINSWVDMGVSESTLKKAMDAALITLKGSRPAYPQYLVGYVRNIHTGESRPVNQPKSVELWERCGFETENDYEADKKKRAAETMAANLEMARQRKNNTKHKKARSA